MAFKQFLIFTPAWWMWPLCYITPNQLLISCLLCLSDLSRKKNTEKKDRKKEERKKERKIKRTSAQTCTGFHSQN